MSRIGKHPITLPDGVELKFESDTVTVKGKQGELTTNINPGFDIKLDDGIVTIERPNESKRQSPSMGSIVRLFRIWLSALAKATKKLWN